MSTRRLRAPRQDRAAIDFDTVRAALGVPTGYPPAARAEALRVVDDPPTVTLDRTDIPLVTIDPAGSMDLDQAMYLERVDGPASDTAAFRVHYAIADVASFDVPGGELDAETHRRGQTLYSPDRSTPLHPIELSEGAASLLPDQTRIAVLWTIDLDVTGEPVGIDVRRAMVRSVAKLDYLSVQREADAGRWHPSVALLPEIGRLRQRAARARHAINLELPDTEVIQGADGHWTLNLRPQNAIEDWNAEISLLTGMCAAKIMLQGQVGLLRTLPPAGDGQIAALQRSAAAFGVEWNEGEPAGDVIARVDRSDPRGGGIPGGCGQVAARCRLHPFRRSAAGAMGARRSRRPLRARHRTATTPGRPIRHRDLSGPAQRGAGAGLGEVRADRVAVGDVEF